MRTSKIVALKAVAVALAGSWALAQSARAADDAVVTKVDGEPAQVSVYGESGAARAVGAGGGLKSGEKVVTSNNQTVLITLKDQSEIALGPQTELTIAAIGNTDTGPGALLKMAYGLLHAAVTKRYSAEHPFVVQTPSSVMGVRGTEFLAEAESGGRSSLHTLEGSVALARNFADLRNPAAVSVVHAGFASTLMKGERSPTAAHRFNPKTVSDYLGQRAPRVLERIRSRMGRNLSKPESKAKGEKPSKRKRTKAPKPPRPKRLRGK